MTTAAALVLFIILCTEICYLVAKHRGANITYWVMMGACFGPFAVPFVFFAKPTHEKNLPDKE